MRPRQRGGVLLGGALVGSLLISAPPAAQAGPAGPAGRTWKITLVTGDLVEMTTVKGRRVPMVAARPGPGRRNKVFRTAIRPDGHVIVTPADVAPLVGRVLDPGLLDVTGLVAQGYDDARRADLPLIIQGAPSVRSGLRGGRDLPSIGAVAVRQPKRGLSAMLARRGVQHIWLDRKVKATGVQVDRNLRQVRAPAAWRAGATGRGVKVAVLDTGVDAGHPDLRGRIAETRNFSDSPDTVDRFGHGTHVAATIAGSGAAAQGERRGVAPDATLAIGKVLDDKGGGSESTVLAGMEWAAARAKVVNLSLGGNSTDGTDPLSLALNKLTAQRGTLFVVAAGNDGEIGAINSPGSADAALTVGAVDARDQLAGFSSRGPRQGRVAVKPEIVAPGVDIVAARAKGTTMGRPLDARYTRASGTSMATPHVAGAAALLLQRHPRWSAAQLKAGLVGASDLVQGADAFERGAGRLNVATAVSGPVLSLQSAPHLGTSAYPRYRPLTTKLGWSARKAVRLALTVRLTDRQGRVVRGAARLDAPRLDIAAGRTASTTLRLDAAKLAKHPGLYAAEVVGQGVRTPVTFYVEPPSHTLTLRGVPLPGTPAAAFSASAGVVNLADVVQFAQQVDVEEGGETRIRVPRGRYSVIGYVNDSTENRSRFALAGTPEILVDRDVTVTLDGAAARPLQASVQGVSTRPVMASAAMVRTIKQGIWTESVYTSDPAAQPVFAQPMGRARTGTFRPYISHRLTAPGEVYELMRPLGERIPGDLTHVVTPAERATMARVHQRFAAFDGDTGKTLSEGRRGSSPDGLLLMWSGYEAWSKVPAATTRTDYLSTGRGFYWSDRVSPGGVAGGRWVDQAPYTEPKPGSQATHTWGRQPLRPGPYSGTGRTISECAPRPTTRARGSMHVELVDWQSRIDGFDCGLDGEPIQLKRKLTLFAGDRKLGERAAEIGDFTVPSGPATYRLRYDNDSSTLLPVSTRTSTTWTFRSAAPAGHTSVRLPLLTVDYDLGLDLRNQPVGKPAVFKAKATGLKLWTSVDDGTTWQAVPVKVLGSGRFSAPLPTQGPDVSLRVEAWDDQGGRIDQQIIKAYRIRP